MADYNLSISNPNVLSGDSPSTIYSGQDNKLSLKITNNTGFSQPLTFGPGGDCAGLKMQISKSTFDTATPKFTIASPWNITQGQSSDSEFLDFTLTPTKLVKLENNGSITLDISKLNPKAPTTKGTKTIILSCSSQDMTASGTITVKGADTKGQDKLFGASNPLSLKYYINSPSAQEPIFTSPLVTTDSYKVENKIHAQINFQAANLPAKSQSHKGSLLVYFDEDNPPFFEVFFPCFVRSADNSLQYLDLTDAFQVGEAGYNGYTSAWNIKCSLSASDPNKINNGNWKIELKESNLFPVWKITPLSQEVFTTSGTGNKPGQVLDLYFSHIYTDLEVNQDHPETFVYFNWYNFIDKINSTSEPLANYSDGGSAETMPKIPVPDIERFSLIAADYFAQLEDHNIYNCTYEKDGDVFAIFPQKSILFFKFNWFIKVASWYSSIYSVNLSPPNGAGARVAGSSFNVDFSKQYTIDVETNESATVNPWTLEVTHTTSGIPVARKQLLPFVKLIDFLKDYLPGKVYTLPKKYPSRINKFLAFSSSSIVQWVNPPNLGGWGENTYTIAATNDGSVQLSISALGAKLIYNPFNDSWKDETGDVLQIPAINWAGLSNLDLFVEGNDIPAMEVQNRRLYLTYRDPSKKTVKFTSTANGWNWESPLEVASDSAKAIKLAPALNYYKDQWQIAYFPESKSKIAIITSEDGKTWSNPTYLESSSADILQIFSDNDRIYVFSDFLIPVSLQGTLGYSESVNGDWKYAALTNLVLVDAQIFKNDGQFYMDSILGLSEDTKSGNLYVGNIAVGDNPLGNMKFIEVGTIVQSDKKPGYLQSIRLPNGAVASLYRPQLPDGFDSQIKISNSIETLASAPAQPAMNFWTYSSSMTYFKNYLLRVRMLTFIDKAMTFKSLFSWPKTAIGANKGTNSSMCTFYVQGKSFLYIAYIDSNDKIQLACSENGNTWNHHDPNIDITASEVSIFVFDWKLWLAFVDSSTKHVLSVYSTDGSIFSNQQNVSTASTTSRPPAVVISPKLEKLYLAIAGVNNKLTWFEYSVVDSNRYTWMDKTTEGNNGLTDSIDSLSLAAFRQNLFIAYTDINNKVEIKTTTNFGNNWSNVSNPPTINSDQEPNLIVFYNQLLLVYKDNADNVLKMVRSIDGQNWTLPESLYTSINGNVGASLWNDRLYLSLETPILPGMISVMNTPGVDATDFPTRSIVDDVTELADLGKIISSYNYLPIGGRSVDAAFYLLTYNSSLQQYFIYKKTTKGSPYDYTEWVKVTKNALPTPKTGFSFGGPFVVTPKGDIILTASKDKLSNDEVWLLPNGTSTYDFTFGKLIEDLVYNQEDNKIYGTSTLGGVWSRSINTSTESWTRMDKIGPGGNEINVQITDNTLLTSTFGYEIISCETPQKSGTNKDSPNQITFINAFTDTIYLTLINNDGSNGDAFSMKRYTTKSGISSNNNDCWKISKDSEGKQCINYCRIKEVPFISLTTYQGQYFVIHQQPDGEGAVYRWESSSSSWIPMGIKGVAITTDKLGNVYVATASGQLLKATSVGSSGEYIITAIGDTFLENINSIAVDFDGVLWVFTENGQLFRTHNETQVASYPIVDTCVFQGLLYLTYRVNEDIKLINSVDAVTWSDAISLDVEARVGPSLCQDGQRIWMTYVSPYLASDGTTNPLYVKSSIDGIKWPQGKGTYIKNQSIQSPMMRFHGSEFEIAITPNSSNNEISLIHSQDTTTWSKYSLNLHPKSNLTIGFIYYNHENKYFMAYTDAMNNQISLISSSNQTTWNKINLGGVYTTNYRPALTVFQNQLIIGYVSSEGTVELLVSPDGTAWTHKSIASIKVTAGFALQGFQGQGDDSEKLYLFFVDGGGNIRSRLLTV